MLDKPVDQWTELDFLRKAYINARDFSVDPSTQTGAVLVPKNRPNLCAFGANRFPPGVKVTEERLKDRDLKLFFIQHAERDCILRAALNGWGTYESTLFAPWFACSDCAKAIIIAGIKRVVGHVSIMEKTPQRWMRTIKEADVMLDEAGIERVYLEGDLFQGDPAYRVLFNGEYWIP
jgi:dCMP deaminase